MFFTRFPTMEYRVRISVLVCLFLIAGAGSEIVSQRRRQPPAKPPRSAYLPLSTEKLPPDKKLRVETFEKVWRTIAYYYFDEKFNGVNWQALKFEFEPKVRAARTDEELHDLLDSILGRLKVSHLAILRPAIFEAIDTAKEAARIRAAERESQNSASSDAPPEDEMADLDEPLSIYGPGIELRIVNGQFVVFRVGANSAAEYRGIKPGFVIETIDDVSLSWLLARVKMLDKSDSILTELQTGLSEQMLNGEKDSTVKIGYLDAKDRKGEVVIRRELLPTSTVSMGSDFPEQQLTFQTRSLNESTGYIYFDNFSLPVIEKFCSAVAEFKSKKSLVIDLRGNSGGVIGVSVALAGMLSDRTTDLGTSIFRYGAEAMIAEPKIKQFKGRIVVLTDELSISAAEMFAASIQASGRAKIIGVKTAGQSLPSVTVDLPTGARLLYPIANYRTSKGQYLEGKGVLPDRVVVLDRASLLQGVDPQLAAAIEELSRPASKVGENTVDRKTLSADTLNATPAPPPPPPAKAAPKQLATVTIKAPAPLPEAPDVIEPKAVALLKEFEKLSGGLDAYSAISSYELTGTVDTVSMAARNSQEYKSYRDGNRRILLILNSPATGEIRNYRDGKSITLSSDFGLNVERPWAMSIAETDFLHSITRSMKPENYKKLVYLGIFDRGERKVHLIDAKTVEGVTVAIYFDTETKMLAGFEGPTGGLSFDDYRKIGQLMFPYNISSQEFLNIKLADVKLNTKIDPKVFEKKENCFDRPIL